MTVLAPPPRPPRTDDPHEFDAPEALIEEARQRARRRRQGYAAAALLVAAAAAVALLGFHNGGGGAQKPKPAPPVPSSVSRVARGGQLTILGVDPGAHASGYPGWYELSTVVRGRLHPFIRCPDRAEWCGEVMSVAWSRDGARLAFSVTSFGGPAAFNGLHIVDLRTGQDRWPLTTWGSCRPGVVAGRLKARLRFGRLDLRHGRRKLPGAAHRDRQQRVGLLAVVVSPGNPPGVCRAARSPLVHLPHRPGRFAPPALGQRGVSAGMVSRRHERSPTARAAVASS